MGTRKIIGEVGILTCMSLQLPFYYYLDYLTQPQAVISLAFDV
jgi:hypothetical protein